jgi:hypothetical protein
MSDALVRRVAVVGHVLVRQRGMNDSKHLAAQFLLATGRRSDLSAVDASGDRS